MTIEKVKEKVNSCRGERMIFQFLGARNQVEEFAGKIVKTYHCVFLIESEPDQRVKSFSYNDVLMKNLLFRKDG